MAESCSSSIFLRLWNVTASFVRKMETASSPEFCFRTLIARICSKPRRWRNHEPGARTGGGRFRAHAETDSTNSADRQFDRGSGHCDGRKFRPEKNRRPEAPSHHPGPGDAG